VLTLIGHLNNLDESQHKYKVLTMLALFTGMRRGELMGLEWKDIDYEKKTINICRTSQYLPGDGVFTKEPKTEFSTRTITIPDTIVALLKDYKLHQESERTQIADLWNPTDRLFTTWNGEPMSPDTITDWFGKFIKIHNLPHVTFHGLRHTNVSLLIAEGVDVRTIASRVGHANPTTTLNLYSHMLRKSDQNAADSLEKRIFGSNVKPPKDDVT
jgi:integrase